MDEQAAQAVSAIHHTRHILSTHYFIVLSFHHETLNSHARQSITTYDAEGLPSLPLTRYEEHRLLDMSDHTPTHHTVGQNATHRSIDKNLSAPSSQDLTSDSPLHNYINTHLTDEEILNGDPKLITGERILQVSAAHTAEEIANVANAGRTLHVLTPKLVYHRIHTACHSVASKTNTTFAMVKHAFNKARVESGVKGRINASLGRAVSAGAATNDASGLAKKPELKGSDTSLTDVEDDATSCVKYLGDFFSSESTMRATNPLFKRIAKGGSKLPENEDLIRLAARHTVMEIVEMVQDSDPSTNITNTKISARIMDALSMFSIARELPRDVVKREFEMAKQANGVVARHYEKISTKRKATTLARKVAPRPDSGIQIASPNSPRKRKRVSSISPDEEDINLLPMQWTTGTRGLATPLSDSNAEEDTFMSDSDDATVAWLDSPSYAKYKPRVATPKSDIYSDSSEVKVDIPEQCLTRDQAAMILLEMRWLEGSSLTDEGAALVLLKIQAEAQDVLMGIPADLNE